MFAFVASTISRGIGALWHKSKAICAVLAILIVSVGFFSIDAFTNSGKIYQGTSIGDVDVSGLTVDEAKNAIVERYANQLSETEIYVFSDEDAKNTIDVELQLTEDEALAEQLSFDEASKKKRLWVANAATIGAEIPTEYLAQQAYAHGRESGFISRIPTFFSAFNIPIYADFNPLLMDKLIEEIEIVIGNPVVEYNIKVEAGHAEVTEGHDGYMIDRSVFENDMNTIFFSGRDDDKKYVAQAVYTPLKIEREQAQRTCDAVNTVLNDGASFLYGDENVQITPEVLGEWVSTDIVKSGDTWALQPFVDSENAIISLVKLVNSDGQSFDVNVTIRQDGDSFIVKPDREVTIPSITTALSQLDNVLFSKYRDIGQEEIAGDRFNIQISTEQYDGDFTLAEAQAYGIVTEISSYTTNYNDSTSTANRTYNIHLVADLIDNSIVSANGGRWSFNDTAGECSVETGFKEAGSIIDGEYTGSIGGGICQVATTVFNAVYESGLPIIERHNHSLYIASYPDGRDAAVYAPTLDLVWENSTASDILFTTSYTNSSVTAHLIGVDPCLRVETEVGKWEEGQKFKTNVEYDEDLSEGKWYVKTNGTDGRDIAVIRRVYDRDGNEVSDKTFVSVYAPTNQVIMAAKGLSKSDVLDAFESSGKKSGTIDTSSSSSSGSSSEKSSEGGSTSDS